MRYASQCATAALFTLCAFLLFWQLGTSTFHSGDEGLHAQCAREMIERSDYLTPYYGGEPFLEKPPAKFWLIATGFHLLGINEWGARLSSALFALGTVAATVLLGRALLGKWPALLAGTILVSSVQFIHEHCGRTAEMEPETAFFFTIGMLLAHRTTADPRWAPALGLALGCLILVKGPIALPALLIVALYLWWRRPLPRRTWRMLVLAGVVMLAVATPWHAYLLATNGDAFREVYLEGQILGRFTGQAADSATAPLTGIRGTQHSLFYPRVLFFSMFPWSLLTLPALGLAAVEVVRRRNRNVGLLLLWIAVFAATIMLARAKFPWYAVPLLPAISLLVAALVDRLRVVESRAITYGLGAIVLAASLLLVPAPNYAPYSREPTVWPFREPSIVPLTELTGSDAASWLPLAASVALLLIVAAVVLWMRRTGRGASLRTAFAGFVVGSLVLTGVSHAVLPLRGVDNRGYFARGLANCAELLREQGVTPHRLYILDEKTLELALRWTSFFYVCELSGGSDGSMARLKVHPGTLQDPRVLRPGTVFIGQPRWAPELRATGSVEELWVDSRLFAAYVRP